MGFVNKLSPEVRRDFGFPEPDTSPHEGIMSEQLCECGREKEQHTGEYGACEHRIDGWFCVIGSRGSPCESYRPAQIEPASDEGEDRRRVMLREAKAFIAASPNPTICAELMADFALVILDLKNLSFDRKVQEAVTAYREALLDLAEGVKRAQAEMHKHAHEKENTLDHSSAFGIAKVVWRHHTEAALAKADAALSMEGK